MHLVLIRPESSSTFIPPAWLQQLNFHTSSLLFVLSFQIRNLLFTSPPTYDVSGIKILQSLDILRKCREITVGSRRTHYMIKADSPLTDSPFIPYDNTPRRCILNQSQTSYRLLKYTLYLPLFITRISVICNLFRTFAVNNKSTRWY